MNLLKEPEKIQITRSDLYGTSYLSIIDNTSQMKLQAASTPTNASITTCPIYQIHITPEYPRVVVIITSKANKEIIRRGRETQTIQARELMQQPATDSNCCKLYQQVTPAYVCNEQKESVIPTRSN